MVKRVPKSKIYFPKDKSAVIGEIKRTQKEKPKRQVIEFGKVEEDKAPKIVKVISLKKVAAPKKGELAGEAQIKRKIQESKLRDVIIQKQKTANGELAHTELLEFLKNAISKPEIPKDKNYYKIEEAFLKAGFQGVPTDILLAYERGDKRARKYQADEISHADKTELQSAYGDAEVLIPPISVPLKIKKTPKKKGIIIIEDEPELGAVGEEQLGEAVGIATAETEGEETETESASDDDMGFGAFARGQELEDQLNKKDHQAFLREFLGSKTGSHWKADLAKLEKLSHQKLDARLADLRQKHIGDAKFQDFESKIQLKSKKKGGSLVMGAGLFDKLTSGLKSLASSAIEAIKKDPIGSAQKAFGYGKKAYELGKQAQGQYQKMFGKPKETKAGILRIPKKHITKLHHTYVTEHGPAHQTQFLAGLLTRA
jgi:hypothetical protein